MARVFHFDPRAVAAAAALGVSIFASGCGSVTNDGDDGVDSPMNRRRQPSDNGAAPANTDPGTNDDDAEAARQGDLDVAETDVEPAASGEGETDESEAAPPAPVFAACWSNGGRYDCDAIHVIVQESEPERCVQLTIDNCDTYGRRTLGVEAPSSWDLSSGSIGSSPEACELGVFNPSNIIVLDASGSVSWAGTTAAPTDLVLDVTLVPAQTAGAAPDVEIATSEPLDLSECPE
jgi:hypothetical protein